MQLALVEKPEQFKLTTTNHIGSGYSGGKDHYFPSHPYKRLEDLDIASKYGIKPPFEKIMTPDQGTSKCEKCQAVYSGYQPYCTAKVRFVSFKDEYRSEVSEQGVVGERVHRKGYWDTKWFIVSSVKYDECGGNLNWSLKDEWEKQKSFFFMLELIQEISDVSPFKEFSDCFLPGVKEHLEIQFMLREIQTLSMTAHSHRGALEQIASKMNQAGGALSF